MNLCSSKVEAGQLEVKQNLVKFNNFVREKQGKVVNNMIREGIKKSIFFRK